MSRWRANGNDAPSVTYDITAGTHLDEILSEGAKCKYRGSLTYAKITNVITVYHGFWLMYVHVGDFHISRGLMGRKRK